jgi:hypothetical protein
VNWFAELLDDLITQNEGLNSSVVTELRQARDRISKEVGLPPRNPVTDSLISQLEDSETLDQVAAVFGTIPVEFGFEDATLIVLNEGGRYLTRRVLSTLPDAWWEDYSALRLFDGDPVIEGILSREHELYVDELIPTHDAPMRYLKAAQSHGIGVNGVIYKIAYPTGLIAAVILNSGRSREYVRSEYRRFRDDLQAIAYATCDALAYFSQVGVSMMTKLTAEEIHFLRLVALSEDPTRALSMECRYGSVANIQAQIVRKLGVKSIFQAVLIAARRGLLDEAIFHPDDVVSSRPSIAGWEALDQLWTAASEEDVAQIA